MKKLFSLLAVAVFTTSAFAQTNRVSPIVTTTQKLNSGATITITYGQPSVKGRTIGVDLEPMDGQVWRTGANEATTIETDKPLRIMHKTLPAGKYAIFTLFEPKTATVIFNKVWKQWGTNKYDANEDVFRVDTKLEPKDVFTEELTFTIDPEGSIRVDWGNKHFTIPVREEK